MKAIYCKIQKFAITASLAMLVVFGMCSKVYASGADILSKFGQEYDSMLENSSASSWAAMKPLINLLVNVLVILGIILILGSIAYIVINAVKTVVGKQGLTKEVWRNFLTALIVGVLVTTSGWMGILNFTQTVVDSGVKVINEAQDTGGSGRSGGSTVKD